MDDSILVTIKKLLGIAKNDKSFDTDIIIHINSILMVLAQEGVIREGFLITDDSEVWMDCLIDQTNLEAVKTLIYLRVRLLFDPPSNSFVINSMNEQIKEFEWRLYTWKDNERIDEEHHVDLQESESAQPISG